MLQTAELRTFEDRITEVQIGSCRLLMLKSEVENIVSWQGSFISNPDFAAREELVQSLVVSLLDKGTVRRDKFDIADVLENKGAEVRFSQRGLRTGFSGQALTDDFEEVFEVLAEQLFTPRFDTEEFEKTRMRIAASVQRNKEQTGARASLALSQLLYDSSHPNYSFSPDTELEMLGEIDVAQLVAYHASHFGANECIIVVVGDIKPAVIERVVSRYFADWPAHGVASVSQPAFSRTAPEVIHVPLEDKFNLDVKMGQQINLRRQDKDFTALHIGNFILGGNFSSRLMDVIRDEMGLTYGVHSSLLGVSKFYNGHWQISITLSQDKLEEGIAATQALVTNFVEKGVSQAEVEEKKETIAGTYKVQMGTTHGLASMILRSLERGFEKNKLDTFPAEIAALTVDDVNRVLQKYLDPKMLQLASAGTKK
ncbi:MAG: M16 family metallopeptidase [Rhodothermales bacterium]